MEPWWKQAGCQEAAMGAAVVIACEPEDRDEVALRLFHWTHPIFPFMLCSHVEMLDATHVRAEFYPWPWKLGV